MLIWWKTPHNFPKNGGKLGGKCEKPLILWGVSKKWGVKVIGLCRKKQRKKITKSYSHLTENKVSADRLSPPKKFPPTLRFWLKNPYR